MLWFFLVLATVSLNSGEPRPRNQKKIKVRFEYADESDPGPYPIPLDAPIEGGPKATGDRHVSVIDYAGKKLYELFSAYPEKDGWRAGSGAIFDLSSKRRRPAGWTSADAAGLPIFPGLVRYEEVVEQKEVRHALRFTVKRPTDPTVDRRPLLGIFRSGGTARRSGLVQDRLCDEYRCPVCPNHHRRIAVAERQGEIRVAGGN